MINDIQNNKENKVIGSVIKGLVISLIITLLFILIISFLLVKTSLSENIINPSIWIITGISLIIGTVLTIRNNGIISGGLVGLFYISLLYILSSTLHGSFSLNGNSIIMILVSIISGGIGGIIGSNLKRM